MVLSTDFDGRQDLFQGKRALLISILVALHHWATGGEIMYFKDRKEEGNSRHSFAFYLGV